MLLRFCYRFLVVCSFSFEVTVWRINYIFPSVPLHFEMRPAPFIFGFQLLFVRPLSPRMGPALKGSSPAFGSYKKLPLPFRSAARWKELAVFLRNRTSSRNWTGLWVLKTITFVNGANTGFSRNLCLMFFVLFPFHISFLGSVLEVFRWTAPPCVAPFLKLCDIFPSHLLPFV